MTRRPTTPSRSADPAPKPAAARRAQQQPPVAHPGDKTPLSSANSADADRATRDAALKKPRPQVTRHV